MDKYTATEQAYKNGYEQGKKDAVKRGYWMATREKLGYTEVDCVECSVCHENWTVDADCAFEIIGTWKHCPTCGAKMGGEADG